MWRAAETFLPRPNAFCVFLFAANKTLRFRLLCGHVDTWRGRFLRDAERAAVALLPEMCYTCVE